MEEKDFEVMFFFFSVLAYGVGISHIKETCTKMMFSFLKKDYYLRALFFPNCFIFYLFCPLLNGWEEYFSMLLLAFG